MNEEDYEHIVSASGAEEFVSRIHERSARRRQKDPDLRELDARRTLDTNPEDPVANYVLGKYFYCNWYGQLNYKRARKHLKIAARNGHARAAFELAQSYADPRRGNCTGLGEETNEKRLQKAGEYWQLAHDHLENEDLAQINRSGDDPVNEDELREIVSRISFHRERLGLPHKRFWRRKGD